LIGELPINSGNGDMLVKNLQILKKLKEVPQDNTSIKLLAGTIIQRHTTILIPKPKPGILSQEQVHDILTDEELPPAIIPLNCSF